MNLVITMAGLGSRFRKAGYDLPKYQIEARGKTLFEWAMMSLEGYRAEGNKYVFIVREEDGARPFIMEMCRQMGFEDFEIVEIGRLTDGQATTAMLAMPYCDPLAPFLVYNIDTFVKPGAMNRAQLKGDGFIPCFLGEGDHWSFVRLDGDGRAVEVVEKRRISAHCTLGAYYFKTAALYERLYQEYYPEGETQKTEKYIAPMYQHLIGTGGEVFICDVPKEDVFVLGTPDELEYFKANYRGF